MKPFSMVKFEEVSHEEALELNGGARAKQSYSDTQYSMMTEASEITAESKLR